MPKLSKENRFIDLSDYGRWPARRIALALKSTWVTPVHVTFSFGFAGLIATYAILNDLSWVVLIFMVLKSILDAADGELSRIRDRPSYIGRYLDSIFDIILNLLFVLCLCSISNSSYLEGLAAFLCIQLQGTLYNYYYVILRNIRSGDTTSRIFEDVPPQALNDSSQNLVNILFYTYKALYGAFDKAIYNLDPSAINVKTIPNWFMTVTSIFGLGSQLLVIGLFMVLGLTNYIIPFFIVISMLIPVFILIRRYFIR